MKNTDIKERVDIFLEGTNQTYLENYLVKSGSTVTNQTRALIDFLKLRRTYFGANLALIVFALFVLWVYFPWPVMGVFFLTLLSIEFASAYYFAKLISQIKSGLFAPNSWKNFLTRFKLFQSVAFTLSFCLLVLVANPHLRETVVIIYLFTCILISTTNFFSPKFNTMIFGLQCLCMQFLVLYFHFFSSGLQTFSVLQMSLLILICYGVGDVIVRVYATYYFSAIEYERMSLIANRELKERNRQINLEKKLIEKVQSTISEAIVLVDSDFQIFRANDAFLQMFAIDPPLQDKARLDDYVDLTHLCTDNIRRTFEAFDDRHFFIEGSWVQSEGYKEHALFVISEITEKVRSDRSAQHIQKISALGELTGGIAHDFHNSLAVIQANTDLILQSKSLDEVQNVFAKDIAKTVDTSTALTRQILNFVRNTPIASSLVNSQDIVDETRTMIQNFLGNRHSFLLHVNGHAWINCNPALLKNAILNLVINARDASKPGQEIVLDIRIDPASQYLIFEVIDYGCGIPQKQIARVFEPFFTLKEREKGTGMGLAMVKQFAENAQGKVEISSVEKQGTKVSIHLPIADVKASQANVSDKEAVQEEKLHKILVVDDNVELAKGFELQLRNIGHEVVVAHSLADVLALQNTDEFDLVLSDVVLENETGLEILEYFKSQKSQAKFMFISGNMSPELGAQIRAITTSRTLEKPISLADLRKEINAFMQPALQ